MLRNCLFMAAALLQGLAAHAADYRVAPPPAWITPVAADLHAPPPDGPVRRGIHYLLLDQQVLLDNGRKQQYRHHASRALNERGVENVSHVEIDFDPAYQTLTLHQVDVVRRGVRQARLRTTPVKVLQRETELESRIYDGSKTANLFLDDVRTGDVVEVAYTLAGSNPVFAGLEFGWMDLQWSAPVAELHRSISLPAGATFKVRNHLSTVVPESTVEGAWQRHVWHLRNIPAMVAESQMPSWFEPYPAVAWSQFEDWSAVVRWATPLYRTEGRISAAVSAEAKRVTAGAADDAARLLAVLRFVQREIRYLGIEIGPGSHAPRDPDLVLKRRYGDCKDKAELLLAMLHSLGMTAHAALVDTYARGSVRERLPSPGAFNHVIVQARLGDQVLWLDPTRPPQMADLSRLAQSNHGAALVLDGTSTGLSDIPAAQGEQRRRRIEQTFDATQGFDRPVVMTLRTVFEGAAAESMRSNLRNQDPASLQRDYLNYYARQYKGLSVGKPMVTADDEAANRLEVTETYTIPDFWEDDKEHRRLDGVFRVPDVRSLLDEPDETVRRTPFALNHPEVVDVLVRARLPAEWKKSAETQEFAHPAFLLRFSRAVGGRDLRLEYHYESRKDHVLPDEMTNFLDVQKRVRSAVGWRLFHDKDGTASSSTPARPGRGPLANFLLAASVLAALWAWGGGLGLAHFIATVRGRAVKADMSARRLVAQAVLSTWLPATGVAIVSFMTSTAGAGSSLRPWGEALVIFIVLHTILTIWVTRVWPPLARARCQDAAELERLATLWHLWPASTPTPGSKAI